MLRKIIHGAAALLVALASAGIAAAPAPKNKPPVVTLASPTTGAVFSAPASVTLSATASDPDGTIAKVDFLRGSTLIASVTTAPYTFNWTGVAAGSYSITAKATDNKGASASSAAASITVTAPQPATTITSPANGSTVTFGNTIDVSGTFVGTAQTTILVHSVQAGSTVLATQTSATTFQARAVPLVTGVNTLTARAIRRDGTSSVGTITVNVPSLMAVMTSPTTRGTYSTGNPVTLRASVGTATGGIQKVEYFRTFVGSLGSSTTAPYSVTVTPAVGDYTVFARVTGTAGNTADSQPITFTVVGPNQLPTVTLTSPTTGQAFAAPASFNLQATASDPDGSVTSVEFLKNGQVIGAYTTAPYTHAISTLAAGTYTFAARVTDNRGGVTTSASASVSVNAPSANPPRVTLVAPAESIPTTVSLTAIVSGGEGGIQRVEFHANDQLIEARTEEPYAVSWPITATGTYVVTATAYDTAGAGTISTPATVPVTDGITYLHTDIAGNVIAASDSAGNQVWKESFRPYGERLNNRLESAGNRQWFHGKEGDAETGLSYFGARYYDPVLGRFMGVDPVGFDVTSVHSINRYAYGNNNPYKYTDPDGRFALPLMWVAGGATFLIVGAGQYANDPRAKAVADRLGRSLRDFIFNESSTNGEKGGEPRQGESGGEGAGKPFGDRTKNEVRDRDGNKCVFCKRDTTREPGPDQSNIDHAEPKADGGNNSANNGQNTCRTCNLDKGRRTTGEFLEMGGRRLPPQYGNGPP